MRVRDSSDILFHPSFFYLLSLSLSLFLGVLSILISINSFAATFAVSSTTRSCHNQYQSGYDNINTSMRCNSSN